ncbi:MAG: hypothetical protein DWI51_01010 [Chloroflexi bacterium]|nr:MAG: hypothetical protein DWI45_02860 [Chloroflexota bacterium]RLT29731.1 MAG: hypothetical protein DWI51_01010 [Chloroflexota bacterium]
MTQRFSSPEPTILALPTPDAAIGDGAALLVRTPNGPAEERTLGTRAVLVVAPPQRTSRSRSAAAVAAAISDASKRAAAIAALALDHFDRDASASPHERARRAINLVIGELGGIPLSDIEAATTRGEATPRADGIAVAMMGLGRDAAWAARTGGITVIGNLTRGSRRSIMVLPDGTPGAGAGSLLRQGVAAARIAAHEGDTIAMAVDDDEARRLLAARDGSLVAEEVKGLLIGLRLPVAIERKATARTDRDGDTILIVRTDPVALAKAQSRARWEEGLAEREERIAATIAPKPGGDARRPESSVTPYEPIDAAAREVLDARRAGVRVATDPRGRAGRVPKATRSARSAAAETTAREAARDRANRAAGAEPRIERSWAERAAASPSGASRLAARIAERVAAAIERRFPRLVAAPTTATLRARNTPELSEGEQARRGRRRTASLLLASILLAGFTGGAALLLNRTEPNLDAASRARTAIESATQAIDEALDPTAQLVINDPERARTLLVGALENLRDADAATIDPAGVNALRARVTPVLDELFLVSDVQVAEIADFSGSSAIELKGIVRGPDGLPYVIDGGSGAVYRVDTASGKATVIYQPGFDLSGARTARAQIITSAGIDIMIFDASSNLWRWRPADTSGRGSLVKVRVRDGQGWGTDIRAIVGFAADQGTGLYRLYVVDPSSRQVLRYQPAPDGTGYPAAPTGYFISPTSLGNVDGIVVDGDLYLTQGGALRRYVGGALDDWTPADPGDGVLRPAPNYTLITSSGESRTGIIYALDVANARVIAFSKGPDGEVLGQYRLAATPTVGSMLGAYIVPAADGGAPMLVWAEQGRIRSAVLGAPITPGGGTTPEPTPPPVIDLPTIKPAP